MAILKRFKDIMEANINSLLDKAEDPEKMIDQYLRNAKEDLNTVKAETAAVIAEEKRTKRELDENEAEAAKMQSYAEKALLAGNEADAKVFLTKKKSLTDMHESLVKTHDLAAANADKMRQMHDKLESDVAGLESRRQDVKAKMKMAKTQEKMANMTSSVNPDSSLDAFAAMEEKANRKLDEAEALAELNTPKKDAAEDLMAKYEDSASDAAVDDELAALKSKLGV